MSTTRNRKIANKGLGLKKIEPLTDPQQLVFEEFDRGQNLFLHGVAGTGKTFISLYLALKEVRNKNSNYQKIIIMRSAEPTKSIGFLPGTKDEKLAPYEEVFESNINCLLGSAEAYHKFKDNNVIEFMSTSFIRGYNFEDTIVIVDESQNLSFHECDSVITRLARNCRIIFCGDLDQRDLVLRRRQAGLEDFLDIVDDMKSFTLVEFFVEDVVRSGLVKEYILAKERHYSGN